MRLALVAPLVAPIREPHVGGSQAFVADLARGLVHRGHSVHLYAASGSRVTDVDVVTHVGRQASQRDRDAWTRMTQFALQAKGTVTAATVEATGIAGRATTLGN